MSSCTQEKTNVQYEDGQAVGVVKSLLQELGLFNKGFHLFTDNFYTKPILAEYLFERRALLTGTIRHNSKGLPQEIKSLTILVNTCKCFRKEEMLLVAFRGENKNHIR